MSKQSFNINEAAEKLGVSTRTVRRYIKAGKIRAELIKGNFGDESRILELPPQLDPNLSMKRETGSHLLILQKNMVPYAYGAKYSFNEKGGSRKALYSISILLRENDRQ